MHILFAQYHLQLPTCHSLKDKRSVIKRIQHAIRSQHNVSVAEAGDHDLWQSCHLAIVTCSSLKETAERTERAILEMLDTDPDAMLGETSREWL